MKIKKKLDGGLKKLLIFFLFFIFSSKNIYGSQILDYETEKFINEIIEKIIEVNGINKKIRFRINSNNEINAFVDTYNIININSGLILYCSDYVALLSVLAHEVGHIDLNHIQIRKKTIQTNKKYNSLGLLSVIAGSSLVKDPGLLQGSIITTAALSNKYISFTKDQEMEADLYALKTLDLLNTNSESIIELLQTIDQKLLENNFSKSNQRVSTHPYIEDRILLIKNFQYNKSGNFDINFNERFNFIKAKFVGYSDNSDVLKKLNEPYKTYAESIKIARNGNLKMSLKSLNEIIRNNQNSFLLETKADILFSHGYTKEAVQFYKKNLEKHPNNYYAQIRIFENINIGSLSNYEALIIFEKNKGLLYKYYNNKNILIKYNELAKKLNKKDWIQFFKFIFTIHDIDNDIFESKINYFKNTKDYDLLKLINIIQNIS